MTHSSVEEQGAARLMEATSGAAVRGTIPLDGEWALRLDPDNAGMAEGWASGPLDAGLKCRVPGCVQAVRELGERWPSPKGMPNGYLGTCWLQREFDLPELPAGRLVWLRLGGVAPAAHIWINGAYAGAHRRPTVTWRQNVTGLVRPGERNVVTVAVVEENKGLLGGWRFAGMNWSGLYGSASIELTGAVTVERLFARPSADLRRVRLSGRVRNDGGAAAEVRLAAAAAPWNEDAEPDRADGVPQGVSRTPGGEDAPAYRAEGPSVEAAAGGTADFAFDVDLPNAKPWSPEAPALYVAEVALLGEDRVLDAYAERFGMRTFAAADGGLRLNGRPFLARGIGHEYFSPTVAPLTDRELIQGRFRAVLAYGYNFIRYHTHVPSREELAIADELGLLLSAEISLVSNFAKTEPFDEGLELLRNYVAETRNHPSLAVYCLGNEGSQLMVDSEAERQHAREGYAAIKRLAPDHVALIAFGMQGELPELPSDAESPHLWSHDFRWGYDGLTRIPWQALQPLAAGKASIVHEYGKFGVWPDPAEEALYPAGGYANPFGRKGRSALEAAGIGEWEAAIIAASRKLSDVCTRNIIEQARRQPGIDGYTMWTFFRHGGRNGGVIDDMGLRPDRNPDVYRLGCNAPLAVLIDRDLDRRTLSGGHRLDIGVSLSNFSGTDAADAAVVWRFEGEGSSGLPEGRIGFAACKDGANREVGRIRADLPNPAAPAKLILALEVLAADGRRLAANAWPLWLFPQRRRPAAGGGLIVCDFRDEAYGRSWRSRVPEAVRLTDLDSMVRGCRSWAGENAGETLRRMPPRLLVADEWNGTAKLALSLGVPVLLLDTGRFPADWYPEPLPADGGSFDVNTQFASFRSGWDQGNIATVISESRLLGDFPHDGFCDAQFYAMAQYARPLRTRAVAEAASLGAGSEAEAGGCEVIIRSVPRLRAVQGASVRVQDPNAVRALSRSLPQEIATEDRAYVLQVKAAGGSLTVCSLRLLDDAGGAYMLEQLLKQAGR